MTLKIRDIIEINGIYLTYDGQLATKEEILEFKKHLIKVKKKEKLRQKQEEIERKAAEKYYKKRRSGVNLDDSCWEE